MTMDYKDSIFLPKTDFDLRANLPTKEPEILKSWTAQKLWEKIKADKKDKPRYVLHDGPPYANGHLHMGHALNKILKDVVNRSRLLMGKNSHYIPGWDCHGLPIEWQIEEQYRKAKKNKDDVPLIEFREECRKFAKNWVDTQSAEFQRLGILGEWDQPYMTMKFDSESRIVGEIHKFAQNGGLYRGLRPVMWSVVEKTALAEAEVEYMDHTSDTIYVKFPVTLPSPVSSTAFPRPTSDDIKALEKETELYKIFNGAYVVIWTTTPWTIPANRAVAYGRDTSYVVVEVTAISEGSFAKVGNKLILAKNLVEKIAKEAGFESKSILELKGGDLGSARLELRHPLYNMGFPLSTAKEGRETPIFSGDFVTDDAGTGFVHIAPSHGEDDFNLWRAQRGVDTIPMSVNGDGTYYPTVPYFGDAELKLNVLGKGERSANDAVIAKLKEAGNLLAQNKVVHSYPHSWRSKAPLIFRATPQWFIAMDRPFIDKNNEKKSLRDVAMQAIADTAFFPDAGRNRLGAMVGSRPDWCISRQRAWGVPIAIFAHKVTGDILVDDNVLKRTVDIIEKEGCDAWYTRPVSDFLGSQYDPQEYEQVRDIVDVWFESGSTHAFVLKPEGIEQADIYLEGSDQHRGWFQSSLLEGCGTLGRAPFREILTHGFVLDEKGRKMSKSLGNVIAPEDILKNYGADILRLWVVSADYSEDLRIGETVLKQQADRYRRIRNTLRYLLGALGQEKVAPVAYETLPELEKLVLHQLAHLSEKLLDRATNYDFTSYIDLVHDFCNRTLSSLYFDIRKDSLYCDGKNSKDRQATIYVMDQIFEFVTRWLAPVLCFTADEAYGHRHPGESIHLKEYLAVPNEWLQPEKVVLWLESLYVRSHVLHVLEEIRAAKKIGSSLEASVKIHFHKITDINGKTVENNDFDFKNYFKDIDFKKMTMVSALEMDEKPYVSGRSFSMDISSFLQSESKLFGVEVSTITSDVVFNKKYHVSVDAEPVSIPAEGQKCGRCWMILPEVGKHADHPELCDRCHDVVIG